MAHSSRARINIWRRSSKRFKTPSIAGRSWRTSTSTSCARGQRPSSWRVTQPGRAQARAVMAGSPADRGPARRRLRPARTPTEGPGRQHPGCPANGSNVASAGARSAGARRSGASAAPSSGSTSSRRIGSRSSSIARPPVRDGHRHRHRRSPKGRLGCAPGVRPAPGALTDRAVDRPGDAPTPSALNTDMIANTAGHEDHQPLRSLFPGRLGELSRASRGGSVRQDCSFVRSHALSSSRTTPIEGPGRFEDRDAQ